MIKMKIILTIIILGILLLAFVGAVSLRIIETDFTKKVLTISTAKICEVELLKNIFEKRCDENTKTEININQDILSITKDPKTKVVRIRNE